MTTILLNDSFNQFCRPGYKKYEKISDDIILIDNFFENFELARNFFISRDKWKCLKYQNNSKPGYESFFPDWVGKSLLEKYILDNKIIDDLNSYKSLCNFLYNSEDDAIWSLPNSNYFPHIDHVKEKDILQYICLINLNQVSISTNFYTYKNFKYCPPSLEKKWKNYTEEVEEEFVNYYKNKKENIKFFSRKQVKEFLDQKKDLKIKLIENIAYKPNQAILYPANLFHSANTTEEFTINNPRIILRIVFEQKEVIKNISYV